MACGREFFFELFEIFDDAVVYDPDLACFAAMWVRVDLGRLAVRRPAQVCNTTVPLELSRDFLLQLRNCSGSFNAARLRKIHTRRIVAAVLQAREAIYQDRSGIFIARVCKDAAHTYASGYAALISCAR